MNEWMALYSPACRSILHYPWGHNREWIGGEWEGRSNNYPSNWQGMDTHDYWEFHSFLISISGFPNLTLDIFIEPAYFRIS